MLARDNFALHQLKMVTVNRLDTPWGRDDLLALATAPVAGVVLAKCEAGLLTQGVPGVSQDPLAPRRGLDDHLDPLQIRKMP